MFLDGQAVARSALVEFLLDDPSGVFRFVGGEGDLVPFGLDRCFDALCAEVGQVTGCALAVATKAEEVGVGATAPGVVSEPEAFAAAVAANGALEVLLALPGPITSDLAAAESVLDLLEGLVVDERLVCALVGDPAVSDHADVVTAGENAVYLASVEGLADVAPRRSRTQSSSFQLAGQLRN